MSTTATAPQGVVDAHHHLWDPGVRRHEWMEDASLEPLQRAFGIPELKALASATGATATVLVQASPSFEESVELCATAARSDGLVAGVVGWVDLLDPDSVADRLAELAGGEGGELLVGLRHPVQDETDPGWLARPEVRRSIGVIGDAGLVYDVLVKPHQLIAAIDLVEALPDVSFVLDHAGKPPIVAGADAVADWAAALHRLGRLDNVVCKLSGLVTETGATFPPGSTPELLRPAVVAVLESFGPSRLMYGSDWPVCLLACDPGDWCRMADELTAALTPDERRHIFATNASTTYRLGSQ